MSKGLDNIGAVVSKDVISDPTKGSDERMNRIFVFVFILGLMRITITIGQHIPFRH